ncbi:MAG: acyl carrier protein, partial [Gammaproteobacteria bacterium]
MSPSNEQLATELLELVSRVARELHPQRPTPSVSLDSDLDSEVGLDSLARVELSARIEEAFKVTLEEETAFSAQSPRDLLAAFIPGTQVERIQIVAPTERAVPQEQAAPAHDATNLVDMLTWHCEANRDREHIRLFSD